MSLYIKPRIVDGTHILYRAQTLPKVRLPCSLSHSDNGSIKRAWNSTHKIYEKIRLVEHSALFPVAVLPSTLLPTFLIAVISQ